MIIKIKKMEKYINVRFAIISILIISLLSCQKRDIAVMPANLPPVLNLAYTLQGDTATLTWNMPTGYDSITPTISGSTNTKLGLGVTSFKYGIVQTNIPYNFTVKLNDAKGNLSLGQTVNFTRAGASPVTNVSGLQNDLGVLLTWTNPSTSITGITITFGTQTITLPANTTSYQFTNVPIGSYTITFVTTNSSNQVSNTVYLPFKVGATTVAYLGIYSDSATLLSTGDDDEIAAAKWLFSKYPTSRYISFNQVKNGTVDLSQIRVLWWNYDLTTTTALPSIALDPTVVSSITSYYKKGGNLLFNQYAVQYFWTLGRITLPYFTEYDGGVGGNNPDVWGVGVNINSKHDQSSHPLYKNISMTTQSDGRITFPVIGAGWKENHNAVIIRIPEYYGGLANNNETAYNNFIADNNAVWLGLWDGIGDYFTAGIIEFQPKNDYLGSSLFIGIGGIEWNQNGTVNPYQSNIQQLYKNAIDYLKTK